MWVWLCSDLSPCIGPCVLLPVTLCLKLPVSSIMFMPPDYAGAATAYWLQNGLTSLDLCLLIIFCPWSKNSQLAVPHIQKASTTISFSSSRWPPAPWPACQKQKSAWPLCLIGVCCSDRGSGEGTSDLFCSNTLIPSNWQNSFMESHKK